MALSYAGFDFEDIRLTRDQFVEMKEDGTLPYGQVHKCLELERAMAVDFSILLLSNFISSGALGSPGRSSIILYNSISTAQHHQHTNNP